MTINEEDIESVDDPENIIEENPIEHVVVIDGVFRLCPSMKNIPHLNLHFFNLEL